MMITRVTTTILPQTEQGKKIANAVIERAQEIGMVTKVEETTTTIEITEVSRTILEGVEGCQIKKI